MKTQFIINFFTELTNEDVKKAFSNDNSPYKSMIYMCEVLNYAIKINSEYVIKFQYGAIEYFLASEQNRFN